MMMTNSSIEDIQRMWNGKWGWKARDKNYEENEASDIVARKQMRKPAERMEFFNTNGAAG